MSAGAVPVAHHVVVGGDGLPPLEGAAPRPPPLGGVHFVDAAATAAVPQVDAAAGERAGRGP